MGCWLWVNKKFINLLNVTDGIQPTSSQTSGTSRHAATRSQTATRAEEERSGTEKTPPRGSPARSGGASPEPNCAICLGKLENKSFTDSCFHQFCYVCLLEWSKVKAECPLCKQTFKSIIHNVRSYDDYDQYYLPRPEDRDPLEGLFPSDGRRFRYRTTVTDHRYFRNQSFQQIERDLQARAELSSLQRPSRHYPSSNHRAWRRLRQAASSSFRRGIYMNSLKVKEPVSTRRRFRETAPKFFRENAACMHRLVPWLNRELNAVLEGRETHVAFVLDLIMGLIKRYNIDSEEFYQHVYPFVGRFTRHFMHEFLMFAKSPYHMAAYDQHAIYEPSSEYVNEESETETIHHSDGNESDVVILSPSGSGQTGSSQGDRRSGPTVDNAPPRIQPTDTNLLPWESSIISMAQPNYSYFNPVLPSTPLFTHMHSHTVTSTHPSASGWDSPIPGPSWNLGGSSDSSGEDTNEIDILNVSRPSSQSSATATITSSSILDTIQPLDLSSTAVINMGDHGADGIPQEPDVYRNFLASLNLAFNRSSQDSAPERSAQPTNEQNPVVCSDTESDSDACLIVDYEKPWLDRSPIPLSTENSSDCELMITGTTNMAPDKRLKKKKKKKTDERTSHTDITDSPIEPIDLEKEDRKRKHRSRSGSLPRQYRKRKLAVTTDEDTSRTHSPLLLRLNVPQYKDKFSKHYRKEKDKSRHKSDRRHRDSHRSSSHSSSRSKKHRKRLISSSSSDGEHVSFRSHKHKSSSGMEIMEYYKKKIKKKKSKKKSRQKSPSPNDFSDLHKRLSDRYRERLASRERDKRHKHKHKHRAREETINSGSLGRSEAHKNLNQLRTSLESLMKKSNDSFNLMRKETPLSMKDDVRFKGSSNLLGLGNKTDSIRSRINALENIVAAETSKETNYIIQNKDNNVGPPADNILGVSSGLEFVEMLPSQANLYDKELESVTQLLSNFAEPSDTPDRTKSAFKKHPHGHKKSSKVSNPPQNTEVPNIQTCIVNSSLEGDRNTVLDVPTPMTMAVNAKEDDIQLNSVTSCTDPEALNIGASSLNVMSESIQSDGEDLDVDGNSDSDIDVLRIDDTGYTSVVAVANDEIGDLSSIAKLGNIINSDLMEETLENIPEIDVEGLSDSESYLVKCASASLVANQNETVEKEIDVTGLSDSDTISYSSHPNDIEDDSCSEIDVLATPNDDIIDADKSLTRGNEQNVHGAQVQKSKTLFLESDFEGIDLDYQYEHGEEIDNYTLKNKSETCNVEEGGGSKIKLQNEEHDASVSESLENLEISDSSSNNLSEISNEDINGKRVSPCAENN